MPETCCIGRVAGVWKPDLSQAYGVLTAFLTCKLTKCYWQSLQPAQRVVRAKFGSLDRHLNSRQSPDDRLESNLAFQASQGGSDTIVNAITETEGAHQRAEVFASSIWLAFTSKML